SRPSTAVSPHVLSRRTKFNLVMAHAPCFGNRYSVIGNPFTVHRLPFTDYVTKRPSPKRYETTNPSPFGTVLAKMVP
ncbi:MAG: hypothetical protein KC421_07365, partial [Anaerolineales bacterium]|nr:hypothetical protein [Anaerolineales bacterium]